jgi:hypothetical protein
MKTTFILFLVGLVILSGRLGAEEEVVSPKNLLPNGSFEAGLNGWLMLENWVVGAQWDSVAEDGAPHGRRVLEVDWRDATVMPDAGAQCLLVGPWFRHGERRLLVSAMVRSDAERTITVGFTHGSAHRREGHEEKRVVGPEWSRVTLQVPRKYNIHRANKIWGFYSPLAGSSSTLGSVYFNFPEKGAYWLDEVQVVEEDDWRIIEPPTYAPASDVELGWSVEGSGVSHERPRFQAVVAAVGKDAPWKGTLRGRVTDYFGAGIQDETFPLELKPGDRIARDVEIRSDRLGYFRVDLSLVDEQGDELAADTFSLVRAREGRGGDAIAVGANQSENSHVNQMAVLARLGFRQTRLYNVVNWATMEPEEGVKAPIRTYMESLMGDSGLLTQVNLAKLPRRVLGDESMHAYPMSALDGYKEYARWTLREIRPWLSAVAYVNEPSAHYASPAENFVAYQRALYDAVQAAAPGVDVVGIQAASGSQGGGLVNYTAQMLRAGGKPLIEAMDVLAIQTHPVSSLPFEMWGWDRVLARLRALADAHGIKRLWSTEMAYHTFPPEEALVPIRGSSLGRRKDYRPSERNQADYMARATLYSLSSTFERVYPFIYAPMAHVGGHYWCWGLTKRNYAYTPRPALAALSTANHMIAGLDKKQARAFITPASLWGGVFAGKDRRLDAVWSSAGPQDVMIDSGGRLEILDLMGNPLAVPAGKPAIFELDGSPVYFAGANTGPGPAHEFLAATWDPGEVWSQSPLKGRAVFVGLESHPVKIQSLRLTEQETGRELFSIDVGKSIPPGETKSLEWEFPLDAPAGLYPLVMEARLEDGRPFRRLFAPMVLGTASERERYMKGEPWVIDDFTEPSKGPDKVRSRAGGTWETQLTFPWFQNDEPGAKRAIEAKDGALRGVVTSKVGKPVRGKPGWITLECHFDEPLNWLAFEGLRIRYRLDRPDDKGALRPDADLSSKGVHIALLDAEGNVFYTTSGHPGLESFKRDGDWYVGELCFDEVHALDEKRAKITTLRITAGPPAQDEDPFGLSLDRIELFTEPCRPKTPAGQETDLHSMPLFDE